MTTTNEDDEYMEARRDRMEAQLDRTKGVDKTYVAEMMSHAQKALDHAQNVINEFNEYKSRVRWFALATFSIGVFIGIIVEKWFGARSS